MSNKARILIVDDEESQRQAIAGFIKKIGYDVWESPDGEHALKQIESQALDLVISDIRMPGINGLELQERARKIVPDITFIFMTAYGSVENAVKAMRQGALNYLSKPIDLDELEINITKALENRHLIAENRELKQLLKERTGSEGIISSSKEMEEVLT